MTRAHATGWALLLCAASLGTASFPGAPARPSQPASAPAATGSVLDCTMNLIDGTPCDLRQYKGKVVVIVNVASKCGLTPQYEGLEALYREHKDAGLVVLGFPANDFRQQEPGTNSEIAAFCRETYGVTFPMFEKITVLGEQRHPLYARLAGLPEPLGGDPRWNFTKFVVDRTGNVVARFEPKTRPDDPEFVRTIQGLLAAPVGAGAETAGS